MKKEVETNSQEASPYCTTALITGMDGIETCHFWIASEQQTLCNFYLNYAPKVTYATTHHNFCPECSDLMNAIDNRISAIDDRLFTKHFRAQERREEQEQLQQKRREEHEKAQEILSTLKWVKIEDPTFRFSSVEIVNPTKWDLWGDVTITYYILDGTWKRLFCFCGYLPCMRLFHSQKTVVKASLPDTKTKNNEEEMLKYAVGTTFRRNIEIACRRASCLSEVETLYAVESVYESVPLSPPVRIEYKQKFTLDRRLCSVLNRRVKK